MCPGQHGQRRKKATDYGTQLAAKQKLRGYYGNISERQFRRYYEMAVRLRGEFQPVADRAAGAPAGRRGLPHEVRHHPIRGASVHFARLHVMVNGRRVNISSYQAKDNDTIRR